MTRVAHSLAARHPVAVPFDSGAMLTGKNRLSKSGPFLLLSALCLFLALCRPAAGAHGLEEKVSRDVPAAAEIKLLLDRDYFPTLLAAIADAHSEIDVAMFLFKPSASARNKPKIVLERLAAARKRGVKVEVVLEKSAYDDDLNKENQHTARLLKDRGIRVRFDRGKATTHAKLVVIDRRYSFIGSHNLTQSALNSNHETSLFIDNRVLAEKLLDYIEKL